MKPIIGLTTFINKKEGDAFNTVNCNYIDSVILGGGIPIVIPINNNTEAMSAYLDMVDGLIFTGGGDVSPLIYGENPIKEIGQISTARDYFEIALFNKAYSANMPILGICRGIQLINVALGGTLYQDINAQVSNAIGHSQGNTTGDELFHRVSLEKNSKLYEIMKQETISTNSFHHQAINKLGRDLKVTGLSSDNIIEAIESTKHPRLLGIQWHPEDLTVKHPEFINIFRSLCDSCKIKVKL